MGLMQDAADAFNADDLDRFLACFAPDAVLTVVPTGQEARGRAAIRGVYEPLMQIPGRRVRVSDEATIGPYLIGVLSAEPPDASGPVLVVNRVAGGKVAASHFFPFAAPGAP